MNNYPTHLTTEELERWAYANGDGLTASLAAEVVDQAAEIEQLEEEKDDN